MIPEPGSLWEFDGAFAAISSFLVQKSIFCVMYDDDYLTNGDVVVVVSANHDKTSVLTRFGLRFFPTFEIWSVFRKNDGSR